MERPAPAGGQFVFVLKPHEISEITETDVAGKGGLQSLQRKLQRQLSGSNTVTFDNAELGQLIRYMTQYKDGGFQGRLRRAFERELRRILEL